MSRDSWRAAYTVQCSRGQRSLRCREETFLPREANPPVAIEGLPLAFCLQLDAVEHNKYAVLQVPLEEEPARVQHVLPVGFPAHLVPHSPRLPEALGHWPFENRVSADRPKRIPRSLRLNEVHRRPSSAATGLP